MAHGRQSYSPETISGLSEAMKKFNPYWLEEPLPPEDHDAYKKLKSKGFVPVATGEHEQEYSGFEDLAQKQASDFLQMDVCCRAASIWD
ncbi:MAG: enolase C-terminal domain-like protein [Bacteroidota bacterium]